MITPKERIKVFISSICGVQKYDIVRAGLRALIESTGFAITYVFEEENVYIKNRISWNIDEIKNIDRSTYDYILQKASLDTNYVVRKRYSMLNDIEK